MRTDRRFDKNAGSIFGRRSRPLGRGLVNPSQSSPLRYYIFSNPLSGGFSTHAVEGLRILAVFTRQSSEETAEKASSDPKRAERI